MKHVALVLLLSGLTFIVSAQTQFTIRGIIRDADTRMPLPYASVTLQETGTGTICNQDGEFVFTITGALSGSITFSYLGYEPLSLAATAFKIGQPITVLLKPNSIKLNEVVVRNQSPLSIVKESIARFSSNYQNNSYSVSGFQREYVKSQSGDFIQLLEVQFETTGTSGAHTSVIRDGMYVEDKIEKSPLWSSSRGGFYTFGWTPISGITTPDAKNFLGIDASKNAIDKFYEFSWDNDAPADESIYTIRFDQKQNIKRPLLRGTIYIDVASLAIIKMSYELSPRGTQFLKSHETWGNLRVSNPPKKITIKKDRAEITYRRFGSHWYLNSVINDVSFDASLVFFNIVQGEKNSLLLHTECVATSIDTTARISERSNIQNIGSIATLQNFIKKEYENYDSTGSWGEFNFIQADTSFLAIATALKLKNQPWELENCKKLALKSLHASHNRKPLTEDIIYLQETLTKVHPGITWYTPTERLAKQSGTIGTQLKKQTTTSEFFKVLSPLIESIHCGHTGLLPSSGVADWLNTSTELFPLSIQVINDSMIVKNAYHDVPAGSRLVIINGNSVKDIISQLKKNIPSDGFNETYKIHRISNEFPLLYATFYEPSDSFDIQFEHEKKILTTNLGGTSWRNDDAVAGFQFLDAMNTMVLSMPSFNAPEGFPRLLEHVFAEAKTRKTKNLIIDIRDNEGGRDEYGLLLFSYIARKEFNYYKHITVATIDTTMLSRLTFDGIPFTKALPHYTSNVSDSNGIHFYKDHPNLGKHLPQSNAFQGTVYILMNGGTFSTASEFAAIAHANHRAIFIGEETGGGYQGNCSLGSPTLTLPNSQIRIRIPLAKYSLAVPVDVFVGHGVMPDHNVFYNTQDIASKRDKEIELCLKLIESLRP